jgi:hypothetical protein
MSSTAFTERVAFFNGQRLFADDLQGLEQFNREMREAHNRSLHQIGVASGYAVSGNKHDREVTIQPGYAIDSSGREIVLLQSRTLQVPPVANDGNGEAVFFDLTVSAADELEESETREGICAPRGAVRYRDEPSFCWVELAAVTSNGSETDFEPRILDLKRDLEKGKRIRLARAAVLNCQLNQSLSIAERRNAKPPAQPFLWAGRTAVSQPWEPTLREFGIEMTVRVDTSEANFRTAPRYSAHVVGNRLLEIDLGGNQKINKTIDGFVRIVRLSDDTDKVHFRADDSDDRVGFRFSLLVPSILLSGADPNKIKDHLKDAMENWYIEWMGIE